MATAKESTAKSAARKVPATFAGPNASGSKAKQEIKPPSRRSVSLPKSGKDPKGGLTAKGRRIYNEATGGHLKPGVRGAADTPEKMLRKGSFLRRHFAHPQGPVVDDKGQPTRQALEAAAWGEPVPKSEADEKELAEKGTELLEQYHAAKGEVKTPSGKWRSAPAKKVAAAKSGAGMRSGAALEGAGGKGVKSSSKKNRG